MVKYKEYFLKYNHLLWSPNLKKLEIFFDFFFMPISSNSLTRISWLSEQCNFTSN